MNLWLKCATSMAITIGQQLGSCEITALLGKGGMGEVYRARDAKLKRDVAIKILPDEFSRDPERVSRFQREAEALAALNHPNIAAIYDLQQVDNTRFLILELVDGDTIADLLVKRGALPVEEALNIAEQICEALEAAHDKGIVHRDHEAVEHEGYVRRQSESVGFRPGQGNRTVTCESGFLKFTNLDEWLDAGSHHGYGGLYGAGTG